jgi:hypothetical protein
VFSSISPQWFLWKNAVFFTPFDFNDAMEAQAYDPLNRRLAVASHSGQMKLFNVEQCGEWPALHADSLLTRAFLKSIWCQFGLPA